MTPTSPSPRTLEEGLHDSGEKSQKQRPMSQGVLHQETRTVALLPILGTVSPFLERPFWPRLLNSLLLDAPADEDVARRTQISSVVGHLEEDLSPGEMILDFSIIHARRGFGIRGHLLPDPGGLALQCGALRPWTTSLRGQGNREPAPLGPPVSPLGMPIRSMGNATRERRPCLSGSRT
jgi:hypothetical protein